MDAIELAEQQLRNEIESALLRYMEVDEDFETPFVNAWAIVLAVDDLESNAQSVAMVNSSGSTSWMLKGLLHHAIDCISSMARG